ncbi:GATA-like domain-containing protein ASCRUDRAFT_74911, partial [Ascoidea rubescens DSM 1968]
MWNNHGYKSSSNNDNITLFQFNPSLNLNQNLDISFNDILKIWNGLIKFQNFINNGQRLEYLSWRILNKNFINQKNNNDNKKKKKFKFNLDQNDFNSILKISEKNSDFLYQPSKDKDKEREKEREKEKEKDKSIPNHPSHPQRPKFKRNNSSKSSLKSTKSTKSLQNLSRNSSQNSISISQPTSNPNSNPTSNSNSQSNLSNLNLPIINNKSFTLTKSEVHHFSKLINNLDDSKKDLPFSSKNQLKNLQKFQQKYQKFQQNNNDNNDNNDNNNNDNNNNNNNKNNKNIQINQNLITSSKNDYIQRSAIFDIMNYQPQKNKLNRTVSYDGFSNQNFYSNDNNDNNRNNSNNNNNSVNNNNNGNNNNINNINNNITANISQNLVQNLSQNLNVNTKDSIIYLSKLNRSKSLANVKTFQKIPLNYNKISNPPNIKSGALNFKNQVENEIKIVNPSNKSNDVFKFQDLIEVDEEEDDDDDDDDETISPGTILDSRIKFKKKHSNLNNNNNQIQNNFQKNFQNNPQNKIAALNTSSKISQYPKITNNKSVFNNNNNNNNNNLKLSVNTFKRPNPHDKYNLNNEPNKAKLTKNLKFNNEKVSIYIEDTNPQTANNQKNDKKIFYLESSPSPADSELASPIQTSLKLISNLSQNNKQIHSHSPLQNVSTIQNYNQNQNQKLSHFPDKLNNINLSPNTRGNKLNLLFNNHPTLTDTTNNKHNQYNSISEVIDRNDPAREYKEYTKEIDDDSSNDEDVKLTPYNNVISNNNKSNNNSNINTNNNDNNNDNNNKNNNNNNNNNNNKRNSTVSEKSDFSSSLLSHNTRNNKLPTLNSKQANLKAPQESLFMNQQRSTHGNSTVIYSDDSFSDEDDDDDDDEDGVWCSVSGSDEDEDDDDQSDSLNRNNAPRSSFNEVFQRTNSTCSTNQETKVSLLSQKLLHRNTIDNGYFTSNNNLIRNPYNFRRSQVDDSVYQTSGNNLSNATLSSNVSSNSENNGNKPRLLHRSSTSTTLINGGNYGTGMQILEFSTVQPSTSINTKITTGVLDTPFTDPDQLTKKLKRSKSSSSTSSIGQLFRQSSFNKLFRLNSSTNIAASAQNILLNYSGGGNNSNDSKNNSKDEKQEQNFFTSFGLKKSASAVTNELQKRTKTGQVPETVRNLLPTAYTSHMFHQRQTSVTLSAIDETTSHSSQAPVLVPVAVNNLNNKPEQLSKSEGQNKNDSDDDNEEFFNREKI